MNVRNLSEKKRIKHNNGDNMNSLHMKSQTLKDHILKLCTYIKENHKNDQKKINIISQNNNNSAISQTILENFDNQKITTNKNLIINNKISSTILPSSTAMSSMSSSKKFLTGYSFCALEAKKFLILNGVTDEFLLKNLPTLHNQQHQNYDDDIEQHQQQQKQVQQNLLLHYDSYYDEKILKDKNIFSNKKNLRNCNNINSNNNHNHHQHHYQIHCCSDVSQQKRQILDKIRNQIFERKRQKIAKLRRQREIVWRPW